MSGPRYGDGTVVGGPITLTYTRSGVVVAGAGGDPDEDRIIGFSGPEGYRGRLRALYVIASVGVNDQLQLGIADENETDYMPLVDVGELSVPQDTCRHAPQSAIDACRQFQGGQVDDNTDFSVYAEASGAGAGTVDIVVVVDWTPGKVSIIPDAGGG